MSIPTKPVIVSKEYVVPTVKSVIGPGEWAKRVEGRSYRRRVAQLVRAVKNLHPTLKRLSAGQREAIHYYLDTNIDTNTRRL